jgi:hypothetical protein
MRVLNGGSVGIGLASPTSGAKLEVQGGRSYFSAASEAYGVGVRYSSSGGPVFFGATSASATPDAQISNAGGTALLTLSNSGNVTIPGTLTVTTPANIVFGSNWVSWTPTVTASGSMTISSLTITDAQYVRVGPLVYFKLQFSCTLGGTASNTIYATVPVNYAGTNSLVPAFHSNGGWYNAIAQMANTNQIEIQAQGLGNYVLGAYTAYVSGFYRAV